ncbi:MAG: hypothetical protein Q6J68_06960 [Thermostichales cyanobacterium SZTDM-1c_bins_54]
MDDFDLGTVLRQAGRVAPAVARLSPGIRSRALQEMAAALRQHMDAILESNTLDLENLRGHIFPDWLAEGLKLTPERLHGAAQRLQALAAMPDPLGAVDRQWRLERRLTVQRYRVPLGVIGIIYEIFPEAGIQALAMGCKTGNAILSAASPELTSTHQTTLTILSTAAYGAGIPEGAIQSLPPEPLWLRQQRGVDLVFAYGRGAWCEQIREQTALPLLAAHIPQGAVYIDQAASWTLVKGILLEKPQTLNRLPELWILVHETWATQYLRDFLYTLVDLEYPIQVAEGIPEHFPGLPPVPAVVDSAQGSSLRLMVIPSFSEAISWLHKHSSQRVHVILSDALSACQRFIQEVDSPVIYVNAFPAQFGSDPLGVAASKLPWRGWPDLHAFTTSKTLVHPFF